MAMDPGFCSFPVQASTPVATQEEIERFRVWARSVTSIHFLNQRDHFEYPDYDAIADELTAKFMAFPDRGVFPLPEIGFEVLNNVNTDFGYGKEPAKYTFTKQIVVLVSSRSYGPEAITEINLLANIPCPLGQNRRNLQGLQSDYLARLENLVGSVRDAVNRCTM